MLRRLPIIICLLMAFAVYSQEKEIGEPMFATYGNMAQGEFGDNDFSQVLFFTLPAAMTEYFNVLIFDPDCGGMYDRSDGLWETNTVFEIYGGEGCLSNSDARQLDPGGKYRSGKLLSRELFAKESLLDGQWHPMGPFSPNQGEVFDDIPGYVFFKMIIEGRTGNDGNFYSLRIINRNSSQPIEGTKIFGYEITRVTEKGVLTSRPTMVEPGRYSVDLPVNLIELPKNENLQIIAEPIK